MRTFDYDDFRRMLGGKPESGTRGDRMLLGRTLAALELLGHTGVRDVEIAYEDDLHPVRWWAGANWGGTRVFSGKFPYPAHAAEDLLNRVINGGQCKRCSGTTVVGIMLGRVPGLIDGFCTFMLTAEDLDDVHGYRYVRTCVFDRELAGQS